MKTFLKYIFTPFSSICVGVLIVFAISSLFNPDMPNGLPWIILLTGVIGSVPTLILYSRKEPTKKQFLIRIIIHFTVVSTLIMTEGYFLKWYNSFPEGLTVFVAFLIIYAGVWLLSYRNDVSLAKDINNALQETVEED